MSVMDLSGAVLAFLTDTLSVTRASAAGSADAAGLFVPPSTSTVSVPAMVAPLVGAQALQRLPEGLRSKDAIEVFSVVALRVDAPGQRPDVITYNGHTWQVQVVDRWTDLGNFYRSIATKVPS